MARKKKAPATVDVTDYTVLLKCLGPTPDRVELVIVNINGENLDAVPLKNGLVLKLLIGRKVLKAAIENRSIEKYA